MMILMISYIGGKNGLQMVVVCITGRHVPKLGKKYTHE